MVDYLGLFIGGCIGGVIMLFVFPKFKNWYDNKYLKKKEENLADLCEKPKSQWDDICERN